MTEASIRVGCVMMERNEANALEPWLRYHAQLFGLENLYVIDHGSEHPGVIATLAAYEARGLNVFRLPAQVDFRDKADFINQLLQGLDAEGLHDILIPMDCDEFLVIRDADGQPSCDRAAILAYLAGLRGQKIIPEIRENYLNILGAPGAFWALPYQKVFFIAGHCGRVDPGSHWDVSGLPGELRQTPLAYVHFHHKPYAKLRESSLEKLRPYVDTGDNAALRAYRGPGWHLVENLLRGETAYHAMMRPGGSDTHVSGLLELFGKLGIDPLFPEA